LEFIDSGEVLAYHPRLSSQVKRKSSSPAQFKTIIRQANCLRESLSKVPGVRRFETFTLPKLYAHLFRDWTISSLLTKQLDSTQGDSHGNQD